MAAGLAEDRARRQDARPRHQAQLHRGGQAAVDAPGVAHGREPALQRQRAVDRGLWPQSFERPRHGGLVCDVHLPTREADQLVSRPRARA